MSTENKKPGMAEQQDQIGVLIDVNSILNTIIKRWFPKYTFARKLLYFFAGVASGIAATNLTTYLR